MRELLSKVKLEGPEVLKVQDLPRGTIYCLQPVTSPASQGLVLFSGTAGSVYQLKAAPNPVLSSKPKESFLVTPEELIYTAVMVHRAPRSQRTPVYGFGVNPVVLFCEDGAVIIDDVVLENFKYEALNGKGVARTVNHSIFRTIGGGLCKVDLKTRVASKVDGIEDIVDFVLDSQDNIAWINTGGVLNTRNLNTNDSAKQLSLRPDSLSNPAVPKENPTTWHALLKTTASRFITAAYNLTHPNSNSYILSDERAILSSVSQGPARSIDQGKLFFILAYHVLTMASATYKGQELILAGLVRDQIDLLAAPKDKLTVVATFRHSESRNLLTVDGTGLSGIVVRSPEEIYLALWGKGLAKCSLKLT